MKFILLWLLSKTTTRCPLNPGLSFIVLELTLIKHSQSLAMSQSKSSKLAVRSYHSIYFKNSGIFCLRLVRFVVSKYQRAISGAKKL